MQLKAVKKVRLLSRCEGCFRQHCWPEMGLLAILQASLPKILAAESE